MSVDLDNSWSPTTSTDNTDEISNFSEEESGQQEQVRICQYGYRVLDFSSQYGSDTSISYTAYNIIGRQSKYPDYGDFPETFAMVSCPHFFGFLNSSCTPLCFPLAHLRSMVGVFTRGA